MPDNPTIIENANDAGAISLPLPVVIAPDGPPPASYWDLVTHQFKKNRYAYFSFWIILALFFIAAWAPVLANGKPFVWTENGQTSYPLIHSLVAPSQDMSVDYLFNFCMFATLTIPLALLVGWFAMGRDKRLFRKRALRLVVLALVLALAPFLSVAHYYEANQPGNVRRWLPLREWRLDNTNYVQSYDEAKSLGLNSISAVFPPVAADPITPTRDYLKAPSSAHLLGTDKDGRDVLARMLHGARVSMSVGFIAVGLATLLGIFFGALAGFYRGWIDIAISRMIETIICFPTFFLILTIVAMIEQRSIFHIMLVMGITGWTGVARLVRGEFLKLADQDFVHSARALGCGNGRLMFRHILPNAMGPVLVSAAFGVAGAILTESSLSYLGFGAPPPTPTWGEMISQGKEYVDEAWWLLVYPGLAIFLTVTVYNLAGDGLRDAMDPKMRK